MKKGSLGPSLKLSLPPPDENYLSKFLTQSGSFMDGDLLVNRDGVRIVSKTDEAAAFNGKKWEKFNSEKVASLAYARIQGKMALVTHFQNSSLMNEDKRCRPILFHSEGCSEAGDQVIQEHLPSNSLNIQISRSNGSGPDSDAGDSFRSTTKDGAGEATFSLEKS